MPPDAKALAIHHINAGIITPAEAARHLKLPLRTILRWIPSDRAKQARNLYVATTLDKAKEKRTAKAAKLTKQQLRQWHDETIANTQ